MELLSFLSINQATVCNTWFRKRDIGKQTWQHPKSKRWHCIDCTEARRCVRQQLRAAKDAWFQRKAAEAERGRHGGRLVWRCIRDIQRSRRGLVPVWSAAVRDEDGSVCSSPEAQQQRWRQYFTEVLNIRSEFSAEELDRDQQGMSYHQRRSC